MKDDARRIGRGTYSFPELKAATDAVESKEDAEHEAIADRILNADAAINADETVSI